MQWFLAMPRSCFKEDLGDVSFSKKKSKYLSLPPCRVANLQTTQKLQTMSSWQPLYATLKNAKFNVLELQNHYKKSINIALPKNYYDGDSGYDCLAITSRNGHVHDGISRQSLRESQKDLGPCSKAILPTEICNGYARVLKDQLQEMGLDCFRMRYMRLKNKNYIMPFHRDRVQEEGGWRLHIPIFTNINCFFQWKSNNNKVHQCIYRPTEEDILFVWIFLIGL